MSNAPLSTLERVETTDPQTSMSDGSGDHGLFAHYVPKDQLTDAYVFATPLLALCGKWWVPTRDGMKFPRCPDCVAVWEQMQDA